MTISRTGKSGIIIFLGSLLFLACSLRSGLLVDTSFFPRFSLWALILLIFLPFLCGRMISIRYTVAEVTFFLLLIWSMLSAFWSVEPTEALLQSLLISLSLVWFAGLAALNKKFPETEDLFIKIILLFLLFSFGLAVLKIVRLPFYDPYRIIAISANNNLYSGFLLISLAFVFTGYIRLKGAWRLFAAGTGIMACFFIIIIQTRAAYLGVTTSLFIVLPVLRISYPALFSRRNIFRGLICLVILGLGIFMFTLSLDQTRRQYFLRKIMVWEYFRSYDEYQAGIIRKLQDSASEDHSKMPAFDYSERYYSNASLRLIFWERSLELIKARPLTGVGAGNWRLVIPSVTRPTNPEHTIGNFTYSEPHNEWIRIIAELGIPGFILALVLLVFPPGFVLCRILCKETKPPPETLFYLAFILGFYVFAAFDFPLRRIEHNIVFWAVVVFMLSKVPLPEIRGGLPVLQGHWVSMILICFLLFSLVFSFFRIKGEYYTLQMFRNERKNDVRVIYYCHKAENFFYLLTPNTLPIAWFEGVACFRLRDYLHASRCFERALKITPYEVRVLNDYGATLFQQGNSAEAIIVLREALRIDPFFDDARYNLGAIYFLTGQTAKARKEIMFCRESQKKRDFLEEMR